MTLIESIINSAAPFLITFREALEAALIVGNIGEVKTELLDTWIEKGS